MPYPEDENSKIHREAGDSPAGQENLERLQDEVEKAKSDFVEQGLRALGASKILTYDSVGGQLKVAVTLGKPDGNSEQSDIYIDGKDAGNVWFNDVDKDVTSPRTVTLRIVGETEHQVIAQAFRDVADLLDKA